MFELKRREKIVELIKMGSEHIEVNLDVGAVQARFAQGYNELLKAQVALNSIAGDNIEATSEKLEQYNVAVTGVLQVVFGDVNTQKLLDFYEGNFTELFTEIYPFIADVIVPKIAEASKRRENELKALYKRRK